MNKKDIIEEMEKHLGLSKKDIDNFLNVFFFEIFEAVRKKENISIKHFGTFKIIKRKPRIGRNPKTGEEIKIPEKETVKFIPSQEWKNLGN